MRYIVKKDSRRSGLIRHHGTRYPKATAAITPRPNLDRTYSPCQTARQSRSPPARDGTEPNTRGHSPRRSLSSREDASPPVRSRHTTLPSCTPSRRAAWWRRTGSNRRPQACKASALPTELRPLKAAPSHPGQDRTDPQWPPRPKPGNRSVVGRAGFEPATSRLSSARSNQLSYQPKA